ncbi:hypothetical protein JMUB5695_01893 [Mycobacterium heckeshornense]|nr:hypothetical protein JMUB5695_01893 [Mycobacterium heckeshornense]
MPRRAPYTDVQKFGRDIPPNVRGLGDVAFKGFQCPTPGCTNWLAIRTDALEAEYSITCDACGKSYGRGDAVKLFDYKLTRRADSSVIQSGVFELLIEDYIAEASEYKYCVLCYLLKPMAAFDRHSARRTGRQSECRLCKTLYNSIKNQTRLSDQHREAAQKRRLVVELGASSHFDGSAVRARFGDKCFNCGRDVSDPGEARFDHTLPARYLWPMTTENATLLCAECNGNKAALWPGKFYEDKQLRVLALKTGIDYDLLAGDPQINPAAIESLKSGDFVDRLTEKFAHYMDEVILIRNRVLDLSGFDFFESSTNISQAWKDKANSVARHNHRR